MIVNGKWMQMTMRIILMTFNLIETLAKAQHAVGVLKAAGYTEAAVVGGALRVLALGGATQDVDIAVICEDTHDYECLTKDLHILIQPIIGERVIHCHDKSGYGSTDGFFGDFRLGNINVVAYDRSTYEDIGELISKFDMNINQWYIDDHGLLENDYFDGSKVEINPHRDSCYKEARLDDRIKRFKESLPNLDWSGINV